MQQHNINDIAYVKITQDGWQMLEAFYRSLIEKVAEPAREKIVTEAIAEMRAKTDSTGYTRMELHEVMHIFGPRLYMGSTKVPIEMTFGLEPSR